MALVEQQIGWLAIEFEPLLRLLHNRAEFLYPGRHRVELDERAARRIGDDGG
ncbi:hypothetical protein SDC9_98832 [bioreactor metagenome]|uniref:Uncharacterized protein n=1 Tax=bioreactor metagenome TaxID=1076179 RepID=A0A645AFW6_9ZZZZ